MFKKSLLAAAVAAALVGLAGCGGDDDDAPPTPTTVAVGDTIVLTTSGRLVSFNRAAPATPVGSIGVTGLIAGDTLVGIDFRPADGLLYALGSAGRVYTVAPSTGVATLKSTLTAAAGDDNPFTTLAGTDFAVDFNPVADRLRVVSNTGANLRISVDTGETITDGAITPAAGAASITAAAYTNAFLGTTATALFDLDTTSGLLHLQDPPNNGGLSAGVALGLPAAATAVNGFDIDSNTNLGYAALGVGGSTGLYSVNLAATSAAATRIGDIAGGEAVLGLALVQPAGPTVLGLTADNRLVAFDPKTPNVLTSTVAISGLAAGEIVIGIDVRPSNRQLYAITSTARIFTVDPASGAATLKSTLVADAADTTAPFTALSGTAFSVDFNPVADRLRVISETGQSLRINVDTGFTTTDGVINRTGTAPSVLAAAYANSFPGTATTVLYNLEANSDVLTRQDPPNDGTLVDLGALGFDLSGRAAFDIAGGANGLALAALSASPSGPFSLYSVSLATGAASLYRNTGDPALSRIGGDTGPALIDIAIRF